MRTLREAPKAAVLFVPGRAIRRRSKQKNLAAKRQELFDLAEEHGFCLQKTSYYKRELAAAVARRLQHRRGQLIYQSAAFSIPGFARHAALSLFPRQLLTSTQDVVQQEDKSLTWRSGTMLEVRHLLGDMLSHTSNYGAGLSRGLCTQSESVIRVLATVMPPMEISWVATPMGLHRLYINFVYLLADGTGELHAPKDPNRREIGLSAAQVQEIRRASWRMHSTCTRWATHSRRTG